MASKCIQTVRVFVFPSACALVGVLCANCPMMPSTPARTDELNAFCKNTGYSLQRADTSVASPNLGGPYLQGKMKIGQLSALRVPFMCAPTRRSPMCCCNPACDLMCLLQYVCFHVTSAISHVRTLLALVFAFIPVTHTWPHVVFDI